MTSRKKNSSPTPVLVIENITFAKPEIIKTYTQEEENLLKNMTDVAFKQKIERKGVGDWRRRYSDFNRFTSKKDFKIRGKCSKYAKNRQGFQISMKMIKTAYGLHHFLQKT